MNSKKLGYMLIIILTITIFYISSLFFTSKITLSSTSRGFITPYAQKLVKEINKENIKSRHKYTLYTANFSENDKTPKPTTDTKNILWLGSSNTLTPDNLKEYDIILTSHPYLEGHLKAQGFTNTFYFPIFAINKNITKNQKQYIALIGDNTIIEEILLEKKIFYHKYQLSDINKIKQNIGNFKAVFVNNTKFHHTSIDIHPIILEIALNNIPIITEYQGFDEIKTFHLFNDNISYYMHKDDASRLIERVLSSDIELEKKTKKTQQYTKDNYSLSTSAKNLKNILEHNKQLENKTLANTINTDIPTAVGHIGAGDYWLASDLNSNLEELGYQTSQTYFNSFIKKTSNTNILVAGFIPTDKNMINRDLTGIYNIVYIAYAQFGQTAHKELVQDKETYILDLIQLSQKDNINSLVLASKELTEELNKRGVNAYYIPQFTNTKRFYPDYNEDLKSEVFFVGVNSFYRTAAPILIEAGLPITIYGPGWDNAKAPYLDNQILRKHYSSAKIVLNDTREGMKKFGFISNRIFDATACETLVISDYMPEIEEIYKDTVPMYKTKEELVELVKYYLDEANEAERKDKAKRAKEITLKNFTSHEAALKFKQIIDTFSQK